MGKMGKTSKKSSKKSRIIIISIFSAVIILIAAIYLGVGMFFKDRFLPGSNINGIDVSSITVEKAEQLIANMVQDYAIHIIEKGDKKESIDGSQINFEYVSDGAVQKLLDDQNPYQWLYAYFNPEDYTMTARTTYDQELLRSVMEGLDAFNEALIVKSADAYIEETATGYELIEEIVGNELDQEKVFELLKNAVDTGGDLVDLVEEDCYLKPEVTSEDETLNKKLATFQKYAKMSVTYDMGDEQEILDSVTIRSWMTVDEKGNVSFDWNQVADWMTEMTDKYETFGKDMDFVTSLGETVTVKHETYGWLVDEAAEVEELLILLEEGESASRTPVYLEGAQMKGENDIGDTYVEIDYTNQRMWFYKDGNLLVDTPVVTGNSSKNHDSPTGIFCIYDKETEAILKGEDYKTPVDFWLPFYDGVGIHDAKWRSSFGGTIYKTGGSHGCVNTPWYKAQIIFDNISIGIPVICYNATVNSNAPAVSVTQPAETRNVEDELRQQESENGTSNAE